MAKGKTITIAELAQIVDCDVTELIDIINLYNPKSKGKLTGKVDEMDLSKTTGKTDIEKKIETSDTFIILQYTYRYLFEKTCKDRNGGDNSPKQLFFSILKEASKSKNVNEVDNEFVDNLINQKLGVEYGSDYNFIIDNTISIKELAAIIDCKHDDIEALLSECFQYNTRTRKYSIVATRSVLPNSAIGEQIRKKIKDSNILDTLKYTYRLLFKSNCKDYYNKDKSAEQIFFLLLKTACVTEKNGLDKTFVQALKTKSISDRFKNDSGFENAYAKTLCAYDLALLVDCQNYREIKALLTTPRSNLRRSDTGKTDGSLTVVDINKLSESEKDNSVLKYLTNKATSDIVRYTYRFTQKAPCSKTSCELLLADLLQISLNHKWNHIVCNYELVEGLQQKSLGEEFNSDINWEKRSVPPRKLAKIHFEKIMNYGRFRGYRYTHYEKNQYIHEITNTLVYNGTEKTLEEIVFPQLKKSKDTWVNSVSLCGKGGSGKTHQFLHLIDIILKNDNEKYRKVIPIYLELNNINRRYRKEKGNAVLSCISAELGVEYSSLIKLLEEDGSNYIFFLDGLNEVTDGILRNIIADSIAQIRAEFKSRIVLSSRDDFSQLFNGLNKGEDRYFEKAEVSELKEKQIQKYFDDCFKDVKHIEKLVYNNLSFQTKELLKTAMGLSMYTTLYMEDPTIDIKDMGHLIQQYALRLMNYDNHGPLVFNNELKNIAYYMTQNGLFDISSNQASQIVGKRVFKKITDSKKPSSIFTYDGSKKYEFSHQLFRDYFCSAKTVDMIEEIARIKKQLVSGKYDKEEKEDKEKETFSIIDDYLQNNYVNNNDDILRLASDFLSKDVLKNAIEFIIDSDYTEYTFPLSMLIRLFAMSNNGCVSELDLSGVDLRNISLSDYQLSSTNSTGVHNKICLRDTVIDENTFLQNGLQSGCSSICTYSLADKMYVAAFSATNVLIYDIQLNTFNVIRGIESNGWVNCCCPINKENNTYVLLGCSSGDIKLFDPKKNTVELIFKYKWDQKCGVDSILSLENDTIVCSDADGNVFIYSDKGKAFIHTLDEKTLKEVQGIFNKKSKKIFYDYLVFEKNLSLISRLTVSDNYLYQCFGNKIYRAKKPIDSDSTFTLFKTYDSDTVIRDIIFVKKNKRSKGLMINKVSEITYIPLSANDGDPEPEESKPYNAENNPDLEYFTKFSPYFEDGKTVIGVSTRNNNLSGLSNFIILEYNSSSDECIGYQIPRTLHIHTAHTGTYFKTPGSDIYRFATCSDDRGIQILTPNDSSIETFMHKGSYNGVRAFDVIDDNSIMIAQYDGSVSLWMRVRSSDKWKCHRVYKVHDRWVRGVKHIGKQLSANSKFITCSSDGTVKITDVDTGESRTVIYSSNHEEMLDIAASDDGKIIYAVTESRLYAWNEGETLPSEHIYPQNKDRKCDKYAIRSVEIFEDSPLFAIETTSREEKNVLCYVSSVSNNIFKTIVKCHRCCTHIQKIKVLSVYNKKILAVIGSSEKDEFFELYSYEKKDKNMEWKYLCGLDYDYIKSNNLMNEDHINLNKRIWFSRFPYAFSQNKGSVNDIAIVPTNNTNSVILCLTHSENAVSYYLLTLDEENFKVKSISLLALQEVDSQPMCVDPINGDQFVIGQLNGSLEISSYYKLLTNESSEKLIVPIIQTHANLISNILVDISKARYENDEIKRRFRKMFDGYFNFGDEDNGEVISWLNY